MARAYTWAALCMVAFGADTADVKKYVPNDYPKDWDKKWWKPAEEPIRNLVKAGALIAAEIDRLQRIPHREEQNRQFREAVKRDDINNAKRILREAGETLD